MAVVVDVVVVVVVVAAAAAAYWGLVDVSKGNYGIYFIRTI